MSDQEMNTDFPVAIHGDVHIVLGPGHRYTLNSQVLRRRSPFFASLLTEENTQVLPKSKKDGSSIRWRLELVDCPSADEIGSGELQMIPLDPRGMVVPSFVRKAAESEGGRAHNPIYDHYHRVLASLYNIPLELNEAGLGTLLCDIIGLAVVAEYLQCVSSISGNVNAILLEQGQDLYRAIAMSPGVWAGLGLRVKSEVVFKEAVIHLVGRWNDIAVTDKYDENYLPARARELCQRKYDELDKIRQRIEHRILKFYPETLSRSAEDGPESFCRQSYSNDVFGWLAVSLFKHWFAAAMASDRHRHSSDGGYWLYTSIAEAGDAYLNHEERGAFHRRFPMSVKGTAVFERWLENIKESVRPLVAPLLKHESMLEIAKAGTECQYLTCTLITKEDFPWVEDHKRKKALETQRQVRHLQTSESMPESEESESDGFEVDAEMVGAAGDASGGLD